MTHRLHLWLLLLAVALMMAYSCVLAARQQPKLWPTDQLLGDQHILPDTSGDRRALTEAYADDSATSDSTEGDYALQKADDWVADSNWAEIVKSQALKKRRKKKRPPPSQLSSPPDQGPDIAPTFSPPHPATRLMPPLAVKPPSPAGIAQLQTPPSPPPAPPRPNPPTPPAPTTTSLLILLRGAPAPPARLPPPRPWPLPSPRPQLPPLPPPPSPPKSPPPLSPSPRPPPPLSPPPSPPPPPSSPLRSPPKPPSPLPPQPPPPSPSPPQPPPPRPLPTPTPPKPSLANTGDSLVALLFAKRPPLPSPVLLSPVAAKPVMKKRPAQPASPVASAPAAPSSPPPPMDPPAPPQYPPPRIASPPPQPRPDFPIDPSVLLDAHNVVRMQHGVANLTWSEELARLSQSWSDKCIWEHSRSVYGENLAMGVYRTAAELARGVMLWTNEICMYDFNLPSFSEGTGHYTQVVWKNTRAVGCGFRVCTGGVEGYGPCKTCGVLTCQYWPPGNYLSTQLFRENVLKPSTLPSWCSDRR